MDFYKKNPNALASLRGTVYEEKILNAIKQKGKSTKKEITKDEAEKILKESQNQKLDTNDEQSKKTQKKIEVKKTTSKKIAAKSKKAKTIKKKNKKS